MKDSRPGSHPDIPELDWSAYYARGAGRAPRDLVLRGAAAAGTLGSAVDLGCGDGTETTWLLDHGWSVTAVDRTAEAMPLVRAHAVGSDRLSTVVADLADYEVPPADLVLACLSLPFVRPAAFDRTWAGIRTAVSGGGVLAVNLFGDRDTWAQPGSAIAEMTFHSREQVEALLAGLDVVELTEDEHDGPSGAGPKHWHTFDVIARGMPGAEPGERR